ncbi:head-tail connector protein [Xenorhabdus bovienii]|uniref:head-tail connector protein n=1 Tax=Xenorhabdus bovienii TaxID=40576 RepID=UPI003519196A
MRNMTRRLFWRSTVSTAFWKTRQRSKRWSGKAAATRANHPANILCRVKRFFCACDLSRSPVSGGKMPFPTVEKLKQQCRIDSDNDAEDSLLNTYARAAIRRAENYLNRRLYEEVVPDTDPDGLFVSEDVELATMILALSGWEMNDINAPAGEVIQITVKGKQNNLVWGIATPITKGHES